MFKCEEINISYFVLAISIFLSLVFGLWLYQDSDIDKYRKFANSYYKLNLYVRYDEAEELRSKTLAEIINGNKLNGAWLPLINTVEDKQLKIQLYTRILMDDPERVKVYERISFIIDEVFSESQRKEKEHYLSELKAIPNINHNYLKKYNLSIVDNALSE